MREEKRFWPELFWYAGGLIPLLIVTVIWTGTENQIVPQRILLIALGALLGGLGFYMLGEYLRPMNSAAKGAQLMVEETEKADTVSGTDNVVSIGQTGGVTAGTYIKPSSASKTEVDRTERHDPF